MKTKPLDIIKKIKFQGIAGDSFIYTITLQKPSFYKRGVFNIQLTLYDLRKVKEGIEVEIPFMETSGVENLGDLEKYNEKLSLVIKFLNKVEGVKFIPELNDFPTITIAPETFEGLIKKYL